MAGLEQALRDEKAGDQINAICNELIPITRSALIDGTIDMVLATPVATLSSHAVAAMAQSVVSGRYEGGILVQLPAEIFVSENI